MRHHYDPAPESCARVRRDVSALLTAWGIDEDTMANAVMVANELASNAVDHARTSFDLVVSRARAAVHLELTDGSSAEPELQAHDVSAVRGRGLQMVDALSSTWSFHHHETGKTVVATIATRPGCP